MAGGNYALRVTQGAAAGTVLQADDTIVFGRKEAANLGGDPQLSGRHAQIYEVDGYLVVQDLGSTNGTFVNGGRISEPTYLQPGDKLRMGVSTIEIEGMDAAGGGAQVGAVPGAAGGTQLGGAVPPAAPGATPAPPWPPAPIGGGPGHGPIGAPAGGSGGGGSNKTLIAVASALAAILLIGGIVALALVLTGGDDEDGGAKPVAGQAPARSKPRSNQSTPSAPAPMQSTGDDVSAEDQEAIKSVIEDFRAKGSSGDTAGACANATDDFTVNKEAADCESFVTENADPSQAGSPLEYESFNGGTLRGSGARAAEVTATNPRTGNRLVFLMDAGSGSWLLSDISQG